MRSSAILCKTMATVSGGAKFCPLCNFVGPSIRIWLSHLRAVHSNDPHFNVMCGIDGCTTTPKSFSALYFHIYRKHPKLIASSVRLESEGEPEDSNDLISSNDLDHLSDVEGTVALKKKFT